jgi:hypothetical protein
MTFCSLYVFFSLTSGCYIVGIGNNLKSLGSTPRNFSKNEQAASPNARNIPNGTANPPCSATGSRTLPPGTGPGTSGKPGPLAGRDSAETVTTGGQGSDERAGENHGLVLYILRN